MFELSMSSRQWTSIQHVVSNFNKCIPWLRDMVYHDLRHKMKGETPSAIYLNFDGLVSSQIMLYSAEMQSDRRQCKCI